VVEDMSSGVCSILRLFVQHYEIMTGMDQLLNLPARPLDVIALHKNVVVNLGAKILLWTKNTTQKVEGGEEGMLCTSIAVLD
jgi:hypothetical protein